MHDLLENIQNWTQNGPMGNDKMNPGMMLMGLLASAGGIAAAGYGSSLMKKIRPDDIKRQLKPWYTEIEGMRDQGQDLMDMDSETNQMFRKQYMGNAQDMAASQMMMNQRNMGPGMSGMVQAQGRQAYNQANQQGQQNFMNQFTKNLGTGAGMVNNATSQMGQYSENIAQSYISNIQQQNQMNASLWGGISNGLLSFVPPMMPGK